MSFLEAFLMSFLEAFWKLKSFFHELFLNFWRNFKISQPNEIKKCILKASGFSSPRAFIIGFSSSIQTKQTTDFLDSTNNTVFF
jgi:hypothetical protein